MPDWGAGAAQALEVSGFIVRSARLPAAINDAQPFESKFTQDAVGGFIGIGILGHMQIVKGAGPLGEAQGGERVFDQALALEGRTGPAHGDQFLFSTLAGDRRRAGEHLEFGRALKASAVLAEEDGQAWGQATAGAGQAGKDAICVEDLEKGLDALLIGGNDA